MATRRRKDALDDESRAMIYEGLNLSELGRLFHMDHRVLVEKLHGVSPSGKRGSANTYKVHEVAPYLVKPIFDVEDRLDQVGGHLVDLVGVGTPALAAGRDAVQLLDQDAVVHVEQAAQLRKVQALVDHRPTLVVKRVLSAACSHSRAPRSGRAALPRAAVAAPGCGSGGSE